MKKSLLVFACLLLAGCGGSGNAVVEADAEQLERDKQYAQEQEKGFEETNKMVTGQK